ncbi:MAG TPA: diaminopimelate epimerase [Armatimonadetes bacterium]|nr:diaminopimelate epimerase [Armatimonadota bacterium]
MNFTKMHGLGNDYVYMTGHDQDLDRYDLGKLSQMVSNRNFGVGSDGLILILPSEIADFRMRIFNPDRSESNMCGNGMRSCAKYVYDHGLTDKTELTFETLGGIVKPSLTVEDGKVTCITVDMGEARLARKDVPFAPGDPDTPAINEELEVDGEVVRITAVNVGNTHCVIFVDDVATAPVTTLGPKIEVHPAFPRRTNVEFIQVLDRKHVKMRVWERGAGETLACGTGATATCVACAVNDLTERAIQVQLPGGNLEIDWHEDNHVFMAGPAVEVYQGVLPDDFLAPALL